MISIEWLSLHHEEGAKVKAGGSQFVSKGIFLRNKVLKKGIVDFLQTFLTVSKKKMLVKADPHFEKWWEWNGRKKL